MLGVAEAATAEDGVELEKVKGLPGVRRGGGASWANVQNILQVHLVNVSWGYGVYFWWRYRERKALGVWRETLSTGQGWGIWLEVGSGLWCQRSQGTRDFL